MTIDEIGKLKLVEEIVANVAKGHSENDENLKDLIQDIYIILLEKEKDIIPLTLKECKYYISRIATNNIYSKTSRYYYKYKKNKHLPLEVWAKEEENNNNANNNDV